MSWQPKIGSKPVPLESSDFSWESSSTSEDNENPFISVEEHLEGSRRRVQASDVSELDDKEEQEAASLFTHLQGFKPGDVREEDVAPDFRKKRPDQPRSKARWEQRKRSEEEQRRRIIRTEVNKQKAEKRMMQDGMNEDGSEDEKQVIVDGPFLVKAGEADKPLGIATCSPPQRVFVVDVCKDSWAAKSGIVIGCEILEVNGFVASSMKMVSFGKAVKQRPLALLVEHTGEDAVFEVVVRRKKAWVANTWDWGYTVTGLFLEISDVKKKRGYPFQDGDRVLAVNRRCVATQDEYKRAILDLESFILTVHRRKVYDVQVSRDAQGNKGFRVSPSPLVIKDILPVRRDLHPMTTGDHIIAVNGIRVGTYEIFKAMTSGKGQFMVTLKEKLPAYIDKEEIVHHTAIQVTVIGAQGLPKSRAYCICEILGASHLTFETKAVAQTQNPTWNVTHKFSDIALGDVISLRIFDKMNLLGKASLPVSECYPQGFEGDLVLQADENKSGDGLKQPKVSLAIKVLDDSVATNPHESAPVLVTIIRASGLLRQLDRQKLSPYCQCKVLGKKGLKFKTRACRGTSHPEWNHTHEFKSFRSSDQLDIRIYDAVVGRDTLLGMASLSHSEIFPHGFFGKLPLEQSGRAEDEAHKTWIVVKVEVIRAVPMRVMISHVEGLRKRDGLSALDLYCICEVLGRRGMSFKTPAVPNEFLPRWDARTEFPEFKPGNGLDFSIWGKKDGSGGADLLGTAMLPPESILPDGFEGGLEINDTLGLRAKVPVLYIKVEKLTAGIISGGGQKGSKDAASSSESDDHSDYSSAVSSLFGAIGRERSDSLDSWIEEEEANLKKARLKNQKFKSDARRLDAALRIQRYFKRKVLPRLRNRDLQEELWDLGRTYKQPFTADHSRAKERAVVMTSHSTQKGAARGWGSGVSVAQLHLLNCTAPQEGPGLHDIDSAVATCLMGLAGVGDVPWQWVVNLVPNTSYGFLLVESMAFGQDMLKLLDAMTRKSFVFKFCGTEVVFELEPSRHFREWQVGQHGDGFLMLHGNIEREAAAAGAKWRSLILAAARSRKEKQGFSTSPEIYRPHRWDVEVIVPEDTGKRHIVYHCRHNGGLGNCLLMFLGLAQRAEARGYDFVNFDGGGLPMYGDITCLFPELPIMRLGWPKPAHELSSRWGALGNNRGSQEKRGPLIDDDVDEGRHIAAGHLRLHEEFESRLLDFAAKTNLRDALGVHIRRTDKKIEAPSNMSLSPADAAKQIASRANTLQASRVFLASDDAAFMAGLHVSLGQHGLPCIMWGSRLSGRSGKATHTDRKIPGLEKAVDALSDCFLLAQCKGLICTYSSLSVVSIFWSNDDYSWTHFEGGVV